MLFRKKDKVEVKPNMFDLPDNGEKIYSLNKMAFLYMHGIELEFIKDKMNGKYYAVADSNCGSILERYRTDVKLHAFLNAYRILRENLINLDRGKKDE